jgi:hypothetical protein
VSGFVIGGILVGCYFAGIAAITLVHIRDELRRIADAAERRTDNSWENQWRD